MRSRTTPSRASSNTCSASESELPTRTPSTARNRQAAVTPFTTHTSSRSRSLLTAHPRMKPIHSTRWNGGTQPRRSPSCPNRKLNCWPRSSSVARRDGPSKTTQRSTTCLESRDPPSPVAVPSRTHAERRKAGDAILSELSGQDGFAEAIESAMGPFGSYLIDHIWGDIWQDGLLSRRDRSLAAMSAAGGLMQVDGFAFNASIGERNGLSRDEIVEVCIQLTVECGYPYGNLALTRLLSTWAESGNPYQPTPAVGKDDLHRRKDAADLSNALTGRSADPETIAEDAQRQLGSLGRLAVDWAWGDVWSRDALSQRDRALVVLAMHLSIGRERELESDRPDGASIRLHLGRTGRRDRHRFRILWPAPRIRRGAHPGADSRLTPPA